MKAILLARVSGKEQEEVNLSIPAQIARLREYAAARGFDEIVEFRITESSIKDVRTKFEAIIDMIRQSKEPLILLADTIDRIQRGFKESAVLDDFRKEGKLEIHFLRENLIISQKSVSSDIIRWDMGVFVSKCYILQISDNVKRSIEQKLRNGELPGKAPIGYLNQRTADDRSEIVPDPLRAHFIRRIFELYATGNHSMEQIADMMNKEGFTTPKGSIIHDSKIELILSNHFYYGVMIRTGKSYHHKYVPLITQELFDQVQEVRKGWHKKPFKAKQKLLLTK